MKILILTASTGGGHNRASAALKHYIKKADSDAAVEIVDAIAECSSLFNFTVCNGFKAIVKLTPTLFGKLYHSADKPSPISDLINIVYSQCAKKLVPLIMEKDPDVVISCHPFASGIVSSGKERFDYHVPLISVVTDFIPHRAYINDGIDAYVTASSEARRILIDSYAIDPDRVCDYGHPVYETFYEGQGRDRVEVLDELGFDPEKKTLLLMAGSFGVTDVLKIYEKLLNIETECQIIVITGRNKRLFDAFEKMLGGDADFETVEDPGIPDGSGVGHPIEVIYEEEDANGAKKPSVFYRSTKNRKPTKLFYFIDNVDDYMHAADLIITKPGGLTVSESIACSLPMAVFVAYPGQELQNAEILEEHGMGITLKKGDAVTEQIGALLQDGEKLNRMRESCRKFVHKNSAKKIYELAKQLAQTN